jgi:hypothetical protein
MALKFERMEKESQKWKEAHAKQINKASCWKIKKQKKNQQQTRKAIKERNTQTIWQQGDKRKSKNKQD